MDPELLDALLDDWLIPPLVVEEMLAVLAEPEVPIELVALE